MVYKSVFGYHTIHIKSDVILEKSDSEDDEHDDEEEEELPAELLESFNDDRGPLYHSTCNEELLHPKDARVYRIRTQEAKGNRDSRVQSDMVVKDFRHVKWRPRLSNPNLEYRTIGIPREEDKTPVQVKLAFLRVNKQVYESGLSTSASKPPSTLRKKSNRWPHSMRLLSCCHR